MLLFIHAFEIGYLIIRGVAIFVPDHRSNRNRAVVIWPDNTMQELVNVSFLVPDSNFTTEIQAFWFVLWFWIPGENLTSISDTLFHDDVLNLKDNKSYHDPPPIISNGTFFGRTTRKNVLLKFY